LTDETENKKLDIARTITVPLSIKVELLTNLLVSAFEGGSTYWLRECDYLSPKEGFEAPAYSDEKFWITGGKMSLFYDDPEDEENRAQKDITIEDLLRGATIMAEKNASHFGDLISENDDAITADVFIQCVLFGEVIYG
jgi:hypothetical protein